MSENFDVSGLNERRNRWGTRYFEGADGEILAKECTKCGEVKEMSQGFRNNRKCLGGKSADCKLCASERMKEYRKSPRVKALEAKNKRIWREENREHIAKWREENKEHLAKLDRNWKRKNPGKRVLYTQIRRARKYSLPDTLTHNQRAILEEIHDGTCYLTGDAEVHIEHVLPLTIGHGGTTLENCYLLRDDLNISKHDANIFEWFKANRQRFKLSQRRFDELIAYLAELNGVTAKEYESFVYWCHANPRTVDEIKADNKRYGYKKPSIEIWREARRDKAIS